MTDMVGFLGLKRVIWFAVTLSLVVLTGHGMSQAQTLPITPSGLQTQVNLSATPPPGTVQYDITGGTRPGGGPNLFHSFGDFGVPNHNIANFLNDTAMPTTNILSRVTGGNPSLIFGTLQTTGFGAANLYLINPAGFVFGANATIDVGGSANFATADYLRMADNANFYANANHAVTLSVAPVVAFGFLGSTPSATLQQGRIDMQGGTVLTGRTLTVIGRDNTFQNVQRAGIEVTGGTVSAPSGRINLVSVSSANDSTNTASGGEVAVGGSGSAMSSAFTGFNTLGEIKVANATVSTVGQPGGTIYLRGGRLTLSGTEGNTFLNSRTDGASNHLGLGMDIEITGGINITAGAVGYAGMASSSTGSGNAGNIHVLADSITLNGYSTGDNATDKSAFIQSIALSPNALGANPRPGKGGDITIVTNSLQMNSLGIIQTKTMGGGSSGTIAITAENGAKTGLVSLSGQNTYITSDTSGDADAGSIIINADHLFLNGSGNQVVGISSQSDTPDIATDPGSFSGNPNGGSINISAGTLKILGGAQIATGTNRGSGQGGLLTVTADSILISGHSTTGSVSGIFSATESPLPGSIPSNFTIAPNTGRGGEIVITSKDLQLTNFGEINASSFHAGPTGNITISTQTLRMNSGSTPQDHNPSRISVNTSSTSPTADAGSIRIIATSSIDMQNGASLTGGSLLNLPRFPTGPVTPAGDAGTIVVSTPSLGMDGAGTGISALTEGDGSAGAITVNGASITLSNGAKISSRQATGSTGAGGTITLTGSSLNVAGGTVETASFGSNRGGNIVMRAMGDATLSGGIVLTTQSTGPGMAGDVRLEAGNNLLLRSATVSTSAAEASGGVIKLTAPNIVRLVDSTLTSSVQGQAGSNGGNISIDPQLVVIQNSSIQANANAGAGGNINITATGAVLIDPNSVPLIKASSQTGINGSVNINAPIQFLSGALVPLTVAYNHAGLSGDRCAADPTGQFSSFVQAGRDGVPQVPGALSPSPLSFLETLTSGSLGSPAPNWAAARLGLESVSVDDSTLFRFHSACRS